MKKTISILIALALTISLSSFNGDKLPRKGESILNDAIKVCGSLNEHCLVFYYKGYDQKFGFVHARVLDFCIVVEPEFDDVYDFGDNIGCLVWVKKGGKWGVFDIDSYEMKTGFKYDKISEFREKSIDSNTRKGVYEAEVELDGEIVTVSIEKYLCIWFYEY